MAPTRVGIVSHTHWDREWHTSHEVLRLQLVELVDELLEALEAEPTLAHFMLDGQTAVVDDYLSLRPDQRARLAGHVAAGRIAIGPWSVLPDEFCTSGETLIRNLQRGLDRADELGGAMRIGYLPDSFGHIAQMPQLLAQFGIRDAVVWRGVPAAIGRTTFDWVAPDGSSVRTEHLYGSYANGGALPDDPAALVARADGFARELGARRGTGAMLLMNGGDRQRVAPWIGRVAASANDLQDRWHFEVTSLPAHLAQTPTFELPELRGELRSGAYASLLSGVISNRVDLRRAVAAAERAVERHAEPVVALFGDRDRHRAALARAWQLLIESSAHDSVCGCVTDDVAADVMTRVRHAREIGDEITRQIVDGLAGADPTRLLIVNPTQYERTEIIEIDLPPGDGRTVRTAQIIERRPEAPFRAVVEAHKAGWVLDRFGPDGFAGRPLESYAVTRPSETGIDVELREARDGVHRVDDDARSLIEAAIAPGSTVTFHLDEASRTRALVRTDMVPGFATATIDLSDDPVVPRPVAAGADGDRLTNGLVTVDIEPEGTLRITGPDGLIASGVGHLVDGGDAGDSYTWSPPPSDTVVSSPDTMSVEVSETGPLRGRLSVSRTYMVPERGVGDERALTARSSALVPMVVAMTADVVADDPLIRLTFDVDHSVRDHRLRVHIPLPGHAEATLASCAFTRVRRSAHAEGGPHERAIPTFPARDCVTAGSDGAYLSVLTDAVTEYELIDDGTALAVTLLRATGSLSRVAPTMRPQPAGPSIATEATQLHGRVRRELALFLHDEIDYETLGRLADRFRVPLIVGATADGSRDVRAHSVPPLGALHITGARVSALLADDTGIVVRCWRDHVDAGTVEVRRGTHPVAGERIDLTGRTLEQFVGTIRLGPSEIATLRLDVS